MNPNYHYYDSSDIELEKYLEVLGECRELSGAVIELQMMLKEEMQLAERKRKLLNRFFELIVSNSFEHNKLRELAEIYRVINNTTNEASRFNPGDFYGDESPPREIIQNGIRN
jgi:hypothetical protein